MLKTAENNTKRLKPQTIRPSDYDLPLRKLPAFKSYSSVPFSNQLNGPFNLRCQFAPFLHAKSIHPHRIIIPNLSIGISPPDCGNHKLWFWSESLWKIAGGWWRMADSTSQLLQTPVQRHRGSRALYQTLGQCKPNPEVRASHTYSDYIYI